MIQGPDRIVDAIARHWPAAPRVGEQVDADLLEAGVVHRACKRLGTWDRIDLTLALEGCGEAFTLDVRAVVVALTTGRGSPTLAETNRLVFQLCQLHGPRAELARRLWRAMVEEGER